MPHLSNYDGRQNRVTAVLEAGILSFDISTTSTLEELAGRLVHLGERHHEALLSVEITSKVKLRGQSDHLRAGDAPAA
jgi:hypothetical protein